MKLAGVIFRMLFAAVILLSINSCARVHGCTNRFASNYNANAEVDNGSCVYGVSFYFDNNGADATVHINGQTGSITANYQNGEPDCSSNPSGCANFAFPVGQYSYTASSASASWSGTVLVDGSGCQDIALAQPTGTVTFWTQLSNVGTITVHINGGSGVITSYITGGVPTCGFTGCATFDLDPGLYNYTASSQTGLQWSGTVSIAADVCQPIEFQ